MNSNPYSQDLGIGACATPQLRSSTGINSSGTERGSRVRPLANELLEAPLGKLFWSQPDADRVAEIERSITEVLGTAAVAEPIQLRDDLYALAVC